jgi:hypothetical protein
MQLDKLVERLSSAAAAAPSGTELRKTNIATAVCRSAWFGRDRVSPTYFHFGKNEWHANEQKQLF